MSSRIERIVMPWVADFNGRGEMAIELTAAEQDDPRLLALVDWWRERERQLAVAQRRENSGDPFTGA